MRSVLILMLIAALCAPAAALDLVPAVTNPGFEQDTAGWSWNAIGGAQVSFEIVTTNPHSGKHCLVFHNNSGIAPNVYGRFATNVSVMPSAKYELSCWVRGEDVAEGAGSSHITDWNSYMLTFPTGTFGWQKVSTEFTTKPGQYGLNLGINISNKCKVLAIDDVKVKPLGGQLQGKGITGIILASPRVVGHDTPASVCVLVDSSSNAAVAVDATISINGKPIAEKRTAIKPGENQIDWEWNTGKSPFGKYDCFVRVLDSDGFVIASGSAVTEVADSPIFADIDKVDARKLEFDDLYRQCAAKGINLAYPASAKAMLEQFIPLARIDVRSGFEYRAKWAVGDFNRTLDESVAMMKAYLQEPALAPVTRRYQAGKVAIDGQSFIGERIDSTGKKDRGPLFFCGYGHFSQARTDMPRWPGYGVNIIQAAEFGPAQVFPTEDKVDLTQVKTLIKTLDDAARNNVRVDWLLSPHYFPMWAMQKYPQLGKGGGGFLGFCVDDPAAKAIVEKFIRLIVPMIKDKTALNSICLTNEPLFPNVANCDNTKQIWIDYLTRAHGDIATLNKRYGTTYASFADVPYGGDPQAYDWIVCDQQRFAGWHRWMADIIHEIAPNVPTHAKVMSTQFNGGYVGFATDQELLGKALELNGNDCYTFPTFNPDWPLDNWLLSASYDMQRSLANKPVFNSENHIAPDGSNYYMTPEHFRTALWLGAVHGQGATTIWVWERAFENSNGFIGSVMERPGCAQAVGTTCIDLNRFAGEVTALQTAKAPVAVVYAMSSMIRHGVHGDMVLRMYQALSFQGVKIDFISEKQLAAGKGSQYRMIVVPEAETITDAAFDAIAALPSSTRVLAYHECFTRNEYGKKRPAEVVKAVLDKAAVLTDGDLGTVLWPGMRKELETAGGLPDYSVVDAKTGKPIWGLEWLPVSLGGRTVIDMISYPKNPLEVKILRGGNEIEAVDLLSLGERGKVATVKSLTPVLAEVK
jgi:hypothetical protein